jgi:hypothetical protein
MLLTQLYQFGKLCSFEQDGNKLQSRTTNNKSEEKTVVTYLNKSRDSSVDIVTRLRAGRSGF